MSNDTQTSRRDFLAASAKVAAVAGLVGGCSQTGGGPKLVTTVGPEPAAIKPDQTVRIGMIGVGGRGNELLKNALAKENNVVVKAIADPDEPNVGQTLERIAQARPDDPAPAVYRDRKGYLELLAREDIDAVMSAVPCCYHAEIYLACFAAGKHFYGEKPMCIAVNEADAIVEAQKKNPKVLCQIGFQRRASSFYNAGIRKIHEGLIGVPFEATGAWRISGGPLGRPGTGTQIWFGRQKMSGDWMLEQACHTWDVMCWVAGALPVAASGRGRRDLFAKEDPERDVTDFYVAHLEFPNGMIVDFEHNWRCPHHDAEHHFGGIFERFVGLEGGIDLAFSPRACTFYPRDPNAKAVELASIKPDPTAESVASFFNALRTNTQPVSTVHNGQMATLTGLLVRKAVYENRRVAMKEIL